MSLGKEYDIASSFLFPLLGTHKKHRYWCVILYKFDSGITLHGEECMYPDKLETA